MVATNGLYFDSATIYYRAFFAVPESVVAPDGTPSGAVRGFFDMVTKLTQQFGGDDVVFAWDDDWRPQWRVDLIDTYKTHRVENEETGVEGVPDTLSPQIGAIADILDAIGVHRIGQEGFEADDILGSLAHRAKHALHVVSGDRDLYQLVDSEKGRHVVSITKGIKNLVTITDDWLLESIGVKGSQYADFATLRGDASDGLPGAKGIGDKTAALLISTYGSLEAALVQAQNDEAPLKPAVRRALVEQADYLRQANQVVRVRTDADLPKQCKVPKSLADPEAFNFLVDDWGVRPHVTRLVKALGISL